jgi:hypothetical protein
MVGISKLLILTISMAEHSISMPYRAEERGISLRFEAVVSISNSRLKAVVEKE